MFFEKWFYEKSKKYEAEFKNLESAISVGLELESEDLPKKYIKFALLLIRFEIFSFVASRVVKEK